MKKEKSKKLSLCLICKEDEIDLALLERALETGDLFKNVDEICVTLTTPQTEKRLALPRFIDKFKIKLSYFDWSDNFAKARQFNFEQATGDFIFWIDVDDVVVNSHLLRAYCRRMEKEHIDGIVLDYQFSFDQYGYCNTRHKKLRLIKASAFRDESYYWCGRLHEDLMARRQTKQIFVQDMEIKHIKNLEKTNLKDNPKFKDIDLTKRSSERNLQIAQAIYQDEPNDPRHLYNLLNAYFGFEQWEKVIEYGKLFLEKSHSEMEKYIVWIRIGDAFYNIQDFESAVCSYENCLGIAPWLPDGYLSLGRAYYALDKIKHAKEFLLDGLRRAGTGKHQYEMIAWNPREYDLLGLQLLAACYFKMSDLEKAVELYKVLVKRFPQNIEIQKKSEELEQMTAELNQVDNYLDEIIALPEKTKETIKPILDKVPKHLRAHPKLLIIQNEYFRKEQSSGKDLAIYCPQTSFEWTPENTKTGIGGSEEAVIRLAPELQKLGWSVTVYNACGLRGYEQTVEGFKPVIWRPFWEFNPRDKWDILISWRHPILFQFKELNAGRRYVWMHDVLPKQEFTTERLANIDKVIVLSKFQRSLFPNIPDAKIMISGNGIIKEQFDTNIIREPYRLIYTSAPDRGLECLIKNIFPLIKKEIREAKLYWFYGWQTFDAIQAEDQKQIAWAESLRHLIKQTTDVIDGDRIGHRELAQEYQKSDIWIYPTMFPEIFCLSAIKAQQGGAVPIVNVMTEVNGQKQKSSLDEVIMDDCGVKTYFDNLYQDGEQQKKFAEIVVKNLKIRKELEKYRERGQLIYQKYNWKLIARQWTDEFQS